MNKLDKAIIGLDADAAISTVLHIRYLKSKGKCGSSIREAVQNWEAGELSRDKNKGSTIATMLVEAFVLDLISGALKQEAKRMADEKDEKENEYW